MFILKGVFFIASVIVEGVGWLFSFVVDAILSFLTWGGTQLWTWIEELDGNTQIPIIFTLGVILFVALLASIVMIPHITFAVVVVVPVSVFILKLIIGWVILFALVYTSYSYGKDFWKKVQIKRTLVKVGE